MSKPELILTETATATRLGRYALGRELGRGFSSIVFEATDTLRGRPVALKVLTLLQNLTPARRHEMSERFEREARAISALSHPAIVAIYDVGHADDGQEYIAMERLEGETLRARLGRVGPLLRSEALPLMVQIADALQYAHGRGIVHRDVKPDNIFLCADGTAKLMDFGVAHVFADDGLTQTGTVVGSPAYMSPEQINGDTLDGRSDVFSLAVTVVEALTGRKPFEGPNIPSVMNRILNQTPQMAGVTDSPLRRALERALAKPPQARTPSAGAFAESLRRVLPFPGSRETVTGTQVMPRPALHTPWRERSGLGPVVAVGTAATAVLIALLSGLRPHPAPPAPAPVVSPATLPAPTLAQRPATGHVPKRHSHVASLPDSKGFVTEHVPLPATPSLTLDTLRALRDAPLPSPVQLSPPQTDFATPAPRRVIATGRRAPRPPPVWEGFGPVQTADVRSSPPILVQQTPQTDFVVPAPRPAPVVPRRAPRPIAPLQDTDGMPQNDGSTTPALLVHWTHLQTPPDVPFQLLPASVGLVVSINQNGEVFRARVTQTSGDDRLDAAAIGDALTWQYVPATRAGRVVPSDVPAQVNFPR